MKCSVESCAKDVHGRGWCRAHYRRWERKGDHQPEVPLRRGICLDTLHEYVDIGDCWEWTRALDQTGYGKVLWQGKRTGGHRRHRIAKAGGVVTVTVTYPTPAKRLSMNDRLHWARKADLTKVWRYATRIHALDQLRIYGVRQVATVGAQAQPPCSVLVSFGVTDPGRRRDPHNTAPTIKAIIDGLVDAGCWPDDTPQYVTVSDPTFHKGDNVIIELIPRNEAAA